MDDDGCDLESVTAFDGSMLLPKWFTIQTLSNQESKVKAAIQILVAERNLGDIVQEILLPSEKVVEVKNGKKYSRVRKFYPGYVFIKMRAYDGEGKFMHDVFSTIGDISGVVRFIGDRNPIELKQSEIDDLLEKVASVAGKPVPKVSYGVGDVVKINDGPFLNMTGTVEDIDTEQCRLRVNVSMFGRGTPVDLEFWQVRRCVDGED
jgi:transcriptional antiterminator NusG